MLEIIESNDNSPYRAIIYGIEGIGKSTFGAKSENPIFISPERGADRLKDRHGKPVKLFKGIDSFDKTLEAINQLTNDSSTFKTLILDTSDWIENAAHEKIIGNSGKSIVTVDKGYGAGYRMSQELHMGLIHLLDNLIEKKNMNVIITSHYQVKQVKDPEMLEDYDQFELKGHDMVTSLWREWSEALLFARFNTFLKIDKDGDSKARAMSDGSRVVHAVKSPAYQAKNRFGLPPSMNFNENFIFEFEKYTIKGILEETLEQVKSEITDMWIDIKNEATKTLVGATITSAGDNMEDLKQIRERLKQITKGI